MKRLMIILMILAIGLAGCTSQQANGADKSAEQSDRSATTVASSPSAQQTEVVDKVSEPIVVKTAISSEIDNLDPWLSAASDTAAVMNNVYEGLVWYDEKGKIIPALAKEWSIADDGLTYSFTLQQAVVFHSGQPLTADDVVYSLEKLAGLNGEEALSSRFAEVSAVEKINDYVVEVTLNQRNAAFLAACIAPILPKDYLDQASAPIGTGPFKFVAYEPGQKVVIAKNQDYWNDRRSAQIDRAEFYIMTDPTAITNALLSGQLDFAGIDPKNVAMVDKEFDILSAPQNMVQLMALNNQREPFNNLKVRQAINYAIDKEAIIGAVANGYGTKLATNMSPIMAQYYQDGLNPYDQDLTKAKQLLSEAGYPQGFRTSVTVPSNYKFHVDTAQVIADQLAQIGIEVTIKQVEWGVWLEDVYKQFNYDMTIIGLTGKLDPHQVLVRYESEYARNFMGYRDAAYDRLIDQAILEIDEAKRAQLYKKCQEMLAEQAAAVYIMDPNLVVAISKDLTGFKFYPLRYLDMSSIGYR